jgi:hypothetical protein
MGRALAATLACLAALTVAVPAATAAPADFAISYRQSGGIAASTSGLVVRPGRHAVAESSGSRAGERRVAFRIGPRTVEALERGLRNAHFGSLNSPGPSGCADCFEYAIAYRGHRVTFDESQIPTAIGGVLAKLESIVSAHTIPPNARTGRG